MSSAMNVTARVYVKAAMMDAALNVMELDYKSVASAMVVER